MSDERLTNLEELKKNIDDNLRKINNLLTIDINGIDVADYFDNIILDLNSYELTQHSTVGNLISITRTLLDKRTSIKSLSRELLTNINLAVVYEKLQEKDKVITQLTKIKTEEEVQEDAS